MKNIRTDLVLEMHEFLKQEEAKLGVAEVESKLRGVEVYNEQKDDIKITRVKITTKEGEERLGKEMGNYITIELENMLEQCEDEQVCDLLSKEIEKLMNINSNENVLIIGLGNKDVTPDSLGPLVVSKLMITRHLIDNMLINENIRPVCAVATGVLGTTGIETFEIVKGIVDRVKPKLVIVVDALAARSVSRIGTTIQIADTGIRPGSGIGNKRKELTKKTLNVPVISIGIPTVIDKNTMINDVIENILSNVSEAQISKIVQDIQKQNNLMVTPKEIDSLMQRMSKIIANGINKALNKEIVSQYI